MPRLLERKLNALSVRRLTKPGRHADGSGLYLNVERTGSKNWLLRVTVKGKARTIGLGSALDVTLAEAREKAARLRKVTKEGGDPIAERDGKAAEDAVPTFEEAARQVFEEHKNAWKNPVHKRQWINSLRDYAFPIIGDRRVAEIGSSDILEVLQPIWLTKPETARRVRQRMRAIFDWCLAKHYRETMNPVDAVKQALPKQQSKQRHFAALPYSEVPDFINQIWTSSAGDLVKIGFVFLIHAACRTSEVLGAQWNEIDMEKAIWTVPAERMKANEEHRVPLSQSSLDLLEGARMYDSKSGYIFPGRNWTKPLSSMVFGQVLRRMKRTDITVHGFRSSFRNWTADCTSTPNDVCEAALAHQLKDKVEAAYNRTDHFEKRRVLMNEWSKFLTIDQSEVTGL